MMKLKNSWIYLFVFLVVACKETKNETSRVASLPFYKDESFTPYWLAPGSKEEKEFHKISSFEFTNQLGEKTTNDSFKGKIYITDFFFTTCPGICSRMTESMVKIQNDFLDNNDVMFLSHSVTPKIDSVSVLKKYADNNGIVSNKWHLVTGDRAVIYNLGRNEYFVENDLGEQKTNDDFLHTENFLLIDKNRHIRGIYNSLNRASMSQIRIDMKALLKE